MKARAINDLLYSWYLKILSNCTRLLVQFWENFEISLVITYTNFKSCRKGWSYKFQLSLLLAVNTKIAPCMYLDYSQTTPIIVRFTSVVWWPNTFSSQCKTFWKHILSRIAIFRRILFFYSGPSGINVGLNPFRVKQRRQLFKTDKQSVFYIPLIPIGSVVRE